MTLQKLTLTLTNDTGVDSKTTSNRVTRDASLSIGNLANGNSLLYRKAGDDAWQVFDSVTALNQSLAGLSDGIHKIRVRQRDDSGNLSPTTYFAFKLDTTTPDPLALTLVDDTGTDDGDDQNNGNGTDDGRTSNPKFLVTGFEKNALVRYKIESSNEQTAEYSEWFSSLAKLNTEAKKEVSKLQDGDHTISVQQADQAGNESQVSQLTFTLDTTADVAIDSNVSSSVNTESHAAFSVSGTSTNIEAGASLTVWIIQGRTSVEAATTQLMADGTWTASVDLTSHNPDLADGRFQVKVVVQDQAGNTAQAQKSAYYDGTIPPAPTLSLIRDTGESDTDSLTADPRLRIREVEKGAVLRYQLNEVESGPFTSARALKQDLNGTLAGISDGAVSLRVMQEDRGGNESPWSDALNINIDRQASLQANVSVAPNGDILVIGSSTGVESGQQVDVRLWDRNGTALEQSLTIDQYGMWTPRFSPTGLDTAGPLKLEAQVTDQAGNTALYRERLIYDESAPIVVVFDLVESTSTDIDMRSFQEDTSYDIYIVVDSTLQAVTFAADQQWSNAAGLDEDDKITLISQDGHPIYGGASQYGNVDFVRLASGSLEGSAYSWGVGDNMAFKLSKGGNATRANGRLPYSTLSLSLWTDQWSALTADQFHYSEYWVTLTDGQEGQIGVDGNAIYTTDPAAFGWRENPAGPGWDVEFSIDGGSTWVTNFGDLSVPGAYGTHALLVRQVNADQSITSDTLTYTFDIVPNNVDQTIVIFDLVDGLSSNHSSRIFDAGTSYEIYIIVDDDDHALNFDSVKAWRGGDQLGTDDTIFLVTNGGFGNPLVGAAGGSYSYATTTNSDLVWFTLSGIGVSLNDSEGLLHRYVSGLSSSTTLWTGQWQAAPSYSYVSSVTANIPVSFAF